jgi:hypothetical protein
MGLETVSSRRFDDTDSFLVSERSEKSRNSFCFWLRSLEDISNRISEELKAEKNEF